MEMGCSLIRGRSCYMGMIIFLGLCIVAHFILQTEYYYMSQPLGATNTTNQYYTKPKGHDVFKPYTFGGVYTIADVCIENDPAKGKVEIRRNTTVSQKRLVVYNAKYSGEATLKVAASMNARDKNWKLLYKTQPVPSSHKYITAYPAYFVTSSCTGNLYHLWQDTVIGLYGALKATNRLMSQEPNQLIFKSPILPGMFNQCQSRDRFKELITAFGVRQYYDTYHAFPAKTCYRNAVLGWIPSDSEIVSDFVINRIPFDINNCDPLKTVTIIQRLNRQILNLEELLKAAKDMGFKNTQVFTFENMTFSEQYAIIRCTDILIGVRGAGLQWLTFMRPNRGLMELSWKKFGLHFSTSTYTGYRGLKTISLLSSKVFLNWNTFSKICRKGKKILKKQQEMILSRSKIIPSDNPWKWADGYFDTKLFQKKLKQLASDVFGYS